MSVMTRVEELSILESGAQQLGLTLSPEQHESLLAYLDLLERWGGVYNLTAVRARPEMLVTHVLDCLAVVAPVQAQLTQQDKSQATVLDVGSGAGLPGVVLAICLPNLLKVTCIDTVAKKAAFIQQAALQLKLSNLKAVHGRVEKHVQQYDIVCSRAFASLKDFLDWTKNCRRDDGVWMAMKGKAPDAELADVSGVQVLSEHALHVPGLNADRCLLWLAPQA